MLKTPNDGASETRKQIQRRVAYMIRKAGTVMIDGWILHDWIAAMDERAGKREGGLGRKKKATK